MILFFHLCLFTLIAWSHDELCRSSHQEPLDEMISFEKKLNLKVGLNPNLFSAPCLKKTPFTLEEMNEWLLKNKSLKSKSKVIHGISFENETPENLESFEKLSTALDFFNQPEPSRQIKFTSSCKKVECAVKEIFGDKAGIQLLFMHQKFGMNGSHLVKTNHSAWKTNELDTVLLALSDFPPGLLPAEKNRQLNHFKRGLVPPYPPYASPKTLANALIEVYDLWDKKSPEIQRYTFFHELGHNLATLAGNADMNSKWMEFSGWTKSTKIENGEKVEQYFAGQPEKIFSGYGRTNPEEDFAESVAAYRYDANNLKKISPQKYHFIKEIIFDNVEYTSADSCQNPKRISDEFENKTASFISQWKPDPKIVQSLIKKCTSLAITEIATNGSYNINSPPMRECYEKALSDYLRQEAINKNFENNPNREFLGPVLKNAKTKPIPADTLKKFIELALPLHKEDLKSSFRQTFKNNLSFIPQSTHKDFEYCAYYFPETKEFNPFRFKKELQDISYNGVKQINEMRSPNLGSNISFTDKEISDLVDLMIK